MSKDYKLKYKDVYIYGAVTQYFLGKDVIEGVETPYKEDGMAVKIVLRRNVVRGYGRRNWQRNKLEAERGNVILLQKGSLTCLVAVQETPDSVIEVFITDVLTSTQLEVAEDIVSQLKFNNVNVTVSNDEHKRLKLEKRFHEGDRVQREAGRYGEYRDDTDYTTTEQPE